MKIKTPVSPRTIILMLILIVGIPFLPLLISRQWHWWQAWAYALISILVFAISRVLAARRNPDIIAERARTFQHKDAKPWDRRLVPWLGVLGGLVLVVAGLDARYGWSAPLDRLTILLALVILIFGYILSSYALIENRFFSGVVRVQTERGHQVVSSGPYRWMRHPGYVGGLLTYLATPFFLSSYWAILPALLWATLLVIRTNLEDQTLQVELEGYRDYAKRVRYRLLPGVW